MKGTLLVCCLLIGILNAYGLDKKEEKSKVTPTEETKSTTSDTKDKRQISSRDTPAYPNAKQDDPEQPQETIYGAKPGHFLIRPLSPQEQQLRNYQPTSRPQSQQLHALGPQLEQSQEIQHFAYLQDISRNHQSKAVAEGKSHTVPKKPSTSQLQQQYAAEEQYVQQLQAQQAQAQQVQAQQVQAQQAHAQQIHDQRVQAQAQLNTGPNQFRPSAYIPQQQLQQQPQGQFHPIQEEHLLRLIEEELQARALQEAQARSYPRAGPQGAPHPADRQGLSGYRSKPEQSQEYAEYIQAQQAGPLQGPQYLPLTGQPPQHLRAQPQPQQQQIRDQPANFYQGPSAISYRTLPNHPLAESSLEKEIEKLLASNRPSAYRHSQPPALLPHRSPFVQQKSYSTTASPSTNLGQASQYSFAPSVEQYSGFQPSPTVPSPPQDHQQQKKYVPSAYSTSQPQYLIESSPSPTKSSKPSDGQYRVKQQSQKSKQSQAKQNLGPVQFYYEPAQQRQQPSPPPAEFQQYPIPSPAPSQSSIFVSQSTGLQPSQKAKQHGSQKPLALPPPNGKPITEAEFQALVDAGYPVQAVPVPVPVPYEQYIKQHPEYQGAHVQIPHRHAQRGAGAITYLRPLPHERHQQPQQLRHPREQTEESVAGKNPSS